jgi:hypothetical protein
VRRSQPDSLFDSSPEVIRMVVMICVSYPLSLPNVEDQPLGALLAVATLPQYHNALPFIDRRVSLPATGYRGDGERNDPDQ